MACLLCAYLLLTQFVTFIVEYSALTQHESCSTTKLFTHKKCVMLIFRVVLGILRSFANLDTLRFSWLSLHAISYFVLSNKVTYLDLLIDIDIL